MCKTTIAIGNSEFNFMLHMYEHITYRKGCIHVAFSKVQYKTEFPFKWLLVGRIKWTYPPTPFIKWIQSSIPFLKQLRPPTFCINWPHQPTFFNNCILVHMINYNKIVPRKISFATTEQNKENTRVYVCNKMQVHTENMDTIQYIYTHTHTQEKSMNTHKMEESPIINKPTMFPYHMTNKTVMWPHHIRSKTKFAY